MDLTWLLVIVLFIITVVIIAIFIYNIIKKQRGNGGGKTDPVVPPSYKFSQNSRYIIPYLMAVYPATSRTQWFNIDSKLLRKLYQSLNWYYLPVVDSVGDQTILREGLKQFVLSRRAPLAGPYKNQWTEAFLSDSTDQQIWAEPLLPNHDSDISDMITCIGSQDNPFDEKDPCTGYCFGNNKDPEKCKSCCSSGSICVKDPNSPLNGMCQLNASSSFCSVFPSTVPNSQGPLWDSGAKGCTADMLQGGKVSDECLQNLFAGTPEKSFLKANKGARDYQFITLIQPYARKQGCPNYAYMEQVAYVCEGVGKMLLTAPKCESPNPTNAEWVGSFTRADFCGVQCNGEKEWEKCLDSGHKWRKSNNIKDMDQYVKENYHSSGDIFRENSMAFTGNNTVGDETVNTGNLKGTSMGPAGCTFKNYSTFDQKGANGKGIWIRKQNNIFGLINGHAVSTDGSIPATVTVKDTYDLGQCRAHPNYAEDPKLKTKCSDKTMFYWEAGYGKFLSLGKTGVYQNYIHFFLTVPNDPQPGGVRLRSCLPETLSMGVGSSALSSLNALSGSGKYLTDKRKTLEGFCTLFQTDSPLGKKYGLVPGTYSTTLNKKVKFVYDFNATDNDWEQNIIVCTGRMYWAKKWDDHCDPLNHGKVFDGSNNTWYNEPSTNGNSGPPGVENAGGLQNPQEGIKEWMKYYLSNNKDWNSAPDGFKGDANLCAVASQCIQCYFPPNLGISNPHYNKPVKMDLDDACLLWQGMYIYGDTGGDEYGYSEYAARCRQLNAQACDVFPYGSYYFSAAIGSCIYAVTAALGWNSSQMALMSTGGGNSKFCTYPGYDYEIVQIANRGVMCSGEDPYSFKLLDITAGGREDILKFYTKYGFIQGSTRNGESNSDADMNQRMKDDINEYSLQPFSSCKMPLNEQNVDSGIWGDKTPNMLFYDKPSGKCDWKDKNYEECIQKGDTPSSWVYESNGKVVTCRDCPYEDAKGSIRDQAKETDCVAKFVPDWMKYQKTQIS